jgi:putative ABC transport system permease protein
MFLHNLKLVLRQLNNNKLHSFIGISSFTIGITICLLIGLFIYNELTVDTCFKKHKNIYRMIKAKPHNTEKVYIDYDEKDVFLKSFPGISSVCPVEMSTDWNRAIFTGERSLYIKGFITTDNSFFDMFSIQIVRSISKNPLDNENSVVLTETTAKQIFGNDNPLGKQITLNANNDLIVSAIIKDFPENASIKANVLLNAENKSIRASYCDDGNGGWYYAVNLYMLLDPITSSTSLTENINNTTKQLGIRESQVRLQALDDIYLDPHIEGSDNQAGSVIMIALFSAIGLLILFLSVVNHINVVLSNQLARLKEIGVNKTIGASFIQLMQYYLVEVVVWLVFSLILSLLFVQMGLPIANQLFNRQLTISNICSFPFLISLGFLTLIIVFISSLAPTFTISKFNIHNFLSGQFGGIRKNSVKRVLTIFQFSIAIILLVSVITIEEQIKYVRHKNIGFNKEHLLWLTLPQNYSHSQALENQLLQNPLIHSASMSMGNPGQILYGTYAKGADGNSFPVNRMDVDEYFLSTLGIELISGRNFLTNDLGKSCLINETAYKKYGWKNFEGKKFDEFNVIGVVKDFHVSSLHHAINGVVLVYKNDQPTSMTLRMSQVNISATMIFIQNTWQVISSNSPFEYHFYDDWFDAMYRDEDRFSKTIGLFSIIALIITCLGLISQSFQTCINRTKEIGIRKVHGASILDIVTMLNKDYTKWVLIANLIAWPVAYYFMNKWLQDFAYRIDISLWVFVLAGGLALVIALTTVSVQAIKAATANPVEALRYE